MKYYFIKKIWVKNIYPLFHGGWSTWDGYEYFKGLPSGRISLAFSCSDKKEWAVNLLEFATNSTREVRKEIIRKHILMLPKEILSRIVLMKLNG